MTVEKLKEQVDKTVKETKPIRDEMTRFIKEYKGEWWGRNKSKIDSEIFVNFLFSTVQATAPLLTDNRPKIDIFAREPYLQVIAEVYSNALEYVWEKTWMDDRIFLACKDALICGMGLLKVYFDPDKDNGLGEVRTDVIDPREFVISPGYDDIWDAAWCGEIRRMPISWVKRMYPDKATEVQAREQGGENEIDLSDRPEEEHGDGDSEFVDVYEIWLRDDSTEEYMEEVAEYDESGQQSGTKQERKKRAKYPNGRIRTFTGDGIELDDRPSPFKHGKPPYVAVYNYRIPHSVWGMGEGKQIEQMNREFNLRLQQVVAHARKHTKQNWILDSGSGIKKEDAERALVYGDQVLEAETSFAQNAILPIETPRVNSSSLDVIGMLPSFIEEITGVTDVTKGRVGKKSRQSASEMSILLESSYTRTRQRIRNLEFALKRWGILIVELMQQFYVESRSFRHTEDEDVVWGTVSNSPQVIEEIARPNEDLMNLYLENPEDLTDDEKRIFEDYHKIVEYIGDDEEVYIDFDINIQTNSTLPLDQQSKANLAIRLAEMKILDPQAVLDIINFPGSKKIIDRMNEEKEKRMKMEMAKQQGGGKSQGPKPPTPGPEQKPQDMQDAIRRMQGGM